MAADHDKNVEMEMDEKLSSRVSSIGSYPVNFSTSHHVFPSNLDLLSGDFSNVGRASSFGFMELLGIPDLGPPLFDFSSKNAVPGQLDQQTVLLEKTTTSDTTAGNPPATPNTSSISTSSTEAPADEQQPKRARDENDQVMDEKVSKSKNKKHKKEREPRFAFVTKSEVDHLEDGYRWRKYGQKAVKNSPFPRSYYRCTTSMCGVKKRVERSSADPTIVVTTYEGQHTHPAVPRGSPANLKPHYHSHYTLPFAGGEGGFSLPAPQQLQQYQYISYLENLQQPCPSIQASLPSVSSLLRDNGLLQDMVNPHPDAKIQ